MSNQVKNKTIIDPSKKRRDYLLEKAQADTLTGVGAIATIGCIGIGALLLFGLFFALAFSPSFAAMPILASCVGMLMVLGVSIWLVLKFWRSSAEAAKAIPYVPPVREQIATLPGNEILLRSSEQPSASTDQLLRAVSAIPATSPDQSLRAASDPIQLSERE